MGNAFEYDGFGRMVERSVGTSATFYLYAGQQQLETRVGTTSDTPETASIQYQYVWSPTGLNSPILRDTYVDGSAVSTDRLYYLTDANGNVTAVTDDTGAVQERYSYDAYGNATIYDASGTVLSSSAVNNTLLFGSMQVDPTTGLYYDRARWFDPATGVFITQDPAQADENLFRYAGNDPISESDPTGLQFNTGGYPSTTPGPPPCNGGVNPQFDVSGGISSGNEQGATGASILPPLSSLSTLLPPFDLSQVNVPPPEPNHPQIWAQPGYAEMVQTMSKADAGSILADQALNNRPAGYYRPEMLAAAETKFTSDMSPLYYAYYWVFTPRGYEPGLGPVTNFSMGVEMAGAGQGAYRMVSGASNAGVTPHELGVNGENSASATSGACKNTQSFPVNGRNRIPDQVLASDVATRRPVHVAEVKNVQYQALTQQLRDDVSLVGKDGRVDVYLPPGATVSVPLQKAFGDPDNPLNRVPLVP
jgi:RHS repeat-associated protein